MSIPEVGKLIQVDPAELMRDNPAALIVNRKSYELMAGYFSPVQMDPPQVLRVATFSADKGEVIRLFVKDGMTRTKFAYDHRDETLPEYPDFRFVPISIRDVTESELRNPLVVPPTERRERQTALNMIQYLRSVVPPTVEHSEIAPDRIAAHLINGWENMVGHELSNKFSALAAISMLDNPSVPMATDTMLRKFLQDQDQLIPEETPEERTTLQNGLMEMASIIRQTKLLRRHIAESAFILVSIGSEVIGGERQALRQIYGLLNTVEANKKLEKAFTQVSERERSKTALGNAMVQTLSQLPPEADHSQVLTLLSQSLRDPNLSFAYIFDIFSSSAPLERYQQVRLEINMGRLKDRYITDYKRDQLTSTEQQLIGNFGRVTYLTDDELRRAVLLVKNADETLSLAAKFQGWVNNQRNELAESGVNPSLIQETLEALNVAQSNLLSATSQTSASRKVEELKGVIAEKRRKISFQVDLHKIGEVADEVYGENLKTGQGALIRDNIALCALREVGSSDVTRVKPVLESLKSLPFDIQLLVIKGDMRLKVAQQRHKAEISRPVIVRPKEPSATPLAIPLQSRPIPMHPEEITDAHIVENRRIEANNQKLTASIEKFNRMLNTLDLDLKDISPENKKASHDLIRRLGQYLFDHPDIVRIVEEYPKLLHDKTKSLENRVYKDQKDASKDTGTRI
ncbi:MAG: hypothetical protein ABIC96_02010 [Patescibacteria group bacterium]